MRETHEMTYTEIDAFVREVASMSLTEALDKDILKMDLIESFKDDDFFTKDYIRSMFEAVAMDEALARAIEKGAIKFVEVA